MIFDEKAQAFHQSRCKDCNKPFLRGEERHYLNTYNMDAICIPCQEKRRINNRKNGKEQRRLL